MKKTNLKKENYAFIDSQNLNLGVRSLGWKLDWRKFRQYLRNKYTTILLPEWIYYEVRLNKKRPRSAVGRNLRLLSLVIVIG